MWCKSFLMCCWCEVAGYATMSNQDCDYLIVSLGDTVNEEHLKPMFIQGLWNIHLRFWRCHNIIPLSFLKVIFHWILKLFHQFMFLCLYFILLRHNQDKVLVTDGRESFSSCFFFSLHSVALTCLFCILFCHYPENLQEVCLTDFITVVNMLKPMG